MVCRSSSALEGRSLRSTRMNRKESLYRPVAIRAVCHLLCFAAAWFAVFPTRMLGQDELSRKVTTRVTPAYPELAKKLNLRGTVKLLVVVSPGGNVKDSKVIGGNPILVNAAMDAVKRWKFEPGVEESTGTVEFKFDPPGH